MKASEFFTPEQEKLITEAIKNAELHTSGEIRVHIAKKCPGDILDLAADIFAELGMHKTALRNGVLFFIVPSQKKFAILGDVGINAKVATNFWDEIKEKMQLHFKNNQFDLGLTEAIKMAGDSLQTHFPYQSNDQNELSNDISYGS